MVKKKIISYLMVMVIAFCEINMVNVKANTGENVSGSCRWKSFSVCTREDGGAWEESYKNMGYTKGIDYATEGSILEGNSDSAFDFNVINSGWDGEYDSSKQLVGNNPYGLTATMEDIPVLPGRIYTISFKIKSTLTRKMRVDNKEDVLSVKHILFNIYDGDGLIKDFESADGMDIGGYIELDSTNDEYSIVSAKIKIPYTYKDNKISAKFALGALLMMYPYEIAMSGIVSVRDFSIVETETLIPETSDTSEVITTTQHVNDTKPEVTTNNDKIEKDNISSIANKNSVKKIKIKKLKKSVKVSWSKGTNITGYQIQYSNKKNFKKAKTKNISGNKINGYIIKNLKTNKKYYIRIRTYLLENGKKYYSTWSKAKVTKIK